MAEQKKDEFQEQELERYGVWVKAGPEEVVEAEEEDYSFADLPSDSAAAVETADAGMHLASDLDALEIPESSYGDDDLGTLDDFGDLGDLGNLDSDDQIGEFDENEDLGSLDNLEEPEDLLADDVESDETPTIDEIDVSEDLDPFSELGSLDELDSLDLEESETSEDTAETFGSSTLEQDEDLITLDDLDLEEPEVDQDPFAALDLESDGLGELEEEAGVEPIMPGSDDEIDEISLEDIQVTDSAEFDIPELEEEHDEHHFTPEEQNIEIVPESPSNHITPEEEEILMTEPEAGTAAPVAPIAGQMEEDERQAFQRIQQELDDIKHELAELRAALKSGAAVELAEPEQTAKGYDDEDGVHHGPGFFEEDEDETIALTGDELDNILNTAEFTEETGETEELEEDFVATDADMTALNLDEVDEVDVPVDEIDEIDLDDSEEAVIDELAGMNIEAELADIESLEDSSDEPIAADELELDLDEIEEIGGDTDLLLEEEVEEDDALSDDTELEIDDSDLDLDEIELEDKSGFEDFAAAVEDDLAAVEPPIDEEDLEVEEIDLDEELQTPNLLGGEDVLEIPSDSSTSMEPSVPQNSISDLPAQVKNEIRSVLSYMDQLLEALPDDKIEEFAQSEHFEVYKRLFEELGLET